MYLNNNYGESKGFNSYNKTNYSQTSKKKEADEKFFKEVSDDFASTAENVVLNLDKDRSGNIALKTNQIRNCLDLINGVSEKVALYNGEDISCFKNEILYIRVKLAYIYGRAESNSGVKDFIDKSKLIELILCIGSNKQRWQIFAKYVEALVAYHKYYGGKD